ncbi:hypothetical protein D3C87_1573960 [compost metagenome]
MVHHDAAAGRQQGGHHAVQAGCLQVDLYMPAQRVDAAQQDLPDRRVQGGQIEPDQVQADADHAGLGQGPQFGFGYVRRHHGHAAQASGGGAQRLHQMAVVGAQEAGLHQHAVAQPMRVQQAQVVGQRGIVIGCMAAGVGKRQALPEYMGVGVDGGAGDGRGQIGLLILHARHGPAMLF